MACDILHLIGQLGRGGAERQLYRLAAALKRRGWSQEIVAFDQGGVWQEPLQALGIPLHFIPGHPVKPWRWWLLASLVKRIRPAVTHAWSPHVACYYQMLPARIQRPLLHGLRIDPTVDIYTGLPLKRLPWRRAVERADCVVSNSQGALVNLRRYGVRLPACKTIPNIIDAGGRAKPGIVSDVPRLVGVGQLIPRKAWDTLLLALGSLAAEGALFELEIAGEGIERSSLQRLAAECAIADRVKFLGDVPDVSSLLVRSHILVHPSRREGLANAIIEGMAEGLPVIATDAAAREIVSHDRNGLLVPPDSPHDLARAIRRLLDRPEARTRLGKSALEWVRSNCGEDQVAEAYEAIYRRLNAICPDSLTPPLPPKRRAGSSMSAAAPVMTEA